METTLGPRGGFSPLGIHRINGYRTVQLLTGWSYPVREFPSLVFTGSSFLVSLVLLLHPSPIFGRRKRRNVGDSLLHAAYAMAHLANSSSNDLRLTLFVIMPYGSYPLPWKYARASIRTYTVLHAWRMH